MIRSTVLTCYATMHHNATEPQWTTTWTPQHHQSDAICSLCWHVSPCSIMLLSCFPLSPTSMGWTDVCTELVAGKDLLTANHFPHLNAPYPNTVNTCQSTHHQRCCLSTTQLTPSTQNNQLHMSYAGIKRCILTPTTGKNRAHTAASLICFLVSS